uniref:Uncharacterized protein n=1 Tax=Vitrella brassicaformis TaxID=1169539 RepID=A0A7S1K4A5_9ALVE
MDTGNLKASDASAAAFRRQCHPSLVPRSPSLSSDPSAAAAAAVAVAEAALSSSDEGTLPGPECHGLTEEGGTHTAAAAAHLSRPPPIIEDRIQEMFGYPDGSQVTHFPLANRLDKTEMSPYHLEGGCSKGHTAPTPTATTSWARCRGLPLLQSVRCSGT